MAAVRLGKNHLRWCDDCNLPVLESKTCPICGKDSREVEITPPGDVRPAFQHDIDLIRKLADEQYGEGSGIALLPEGHPVLLNKAPSLDRMDEIIIDGSTVATIRYDLGRGWRLINRMQSAMRIAPVMTKGYVICDDSAVPFVQDSKNLMAPGVIDAHKDIKIGDEVIVITKDRKAIDGSLSGREKEILADIHYQDGYSLYIGIPFCPSTCLYCSFTSYPIGAYRKRVEEYIDCLIEEMKATAEIIGLFVKFLAKIHLLKDKKKAIAKVNIAITKCFLKFLCERNANLTPFSANIQLL